MIDFKTDGDQYVLLSPLISDLRPLFDLHSRTYNPVLQALSPLRDAGHLTTFKNGQLIQGAVTAVGTGNTPLAKVLAATSRDLFYDAHIQDIGDTPPAPGVEWGPEIAPLASANFPDVNGILGEVGPEASFPYQMQIADSIYSARHIPGLLATSLGGPTTNSLISLEQLTLRILNLASTAPKIEMAFILNSCTTSRTSLMPIGWRM